MFKISQSLWKQMPTVTSYLIRQMKREQEFHLRHGAQLTHGKILLFNKTLKTFGANAENEMKSWRLKKSWTNIIK